MHDSTVWCSASDISRDGNLLESCHQEWMASANVLWRLPLVIDFGTAPVAEEQKERKGSHDGWIPGMLQLLKGSC